MSLSLPVHLSCSPLTASVFRCLALANEQNPTPYNVTIPVIHRPFSRHVPNQSRSAEAPALGEIQ